jgi:hypothetical protein
LVFGCQTGRTDLGLFPRGVADVPGAHKA